MEPQKSPKKNNGLRNAAILSGVAIQMGIIIFLAAKGGIWLDNYFEMESKTFVIILTLVGVVVSIYLVIQQLKRINN
ncbi:MULTISPECIES: AtpZ/AtpI family protein [Arenibacter]|uniref:AtpZ/AtpI family protein n=1 Tax=Arenibacter TaxID=178469 RepID=UPI000A3C0199|nr:MULTISPECIES: AtpZ/AtpI family protein [Arenibacter]